MTTSLGENAVAGFDRNPIKQKNNLLPRGGGGFRRGGGPRGPPPSSTLWSKILYSTGQAFPHRRGKEMSWDGSFLFREVDR